jgi:enoyl-CoA hydratase
MPRTFESERTGRVLIVRFDNPPSNFMNRDMVQELKELIDSLEGDHTVGAVVLTGGRDRLFVTHYDVEEILAGSEGVGMEVSAQVAGASLRAVAGLSRVPGGDAALKRTPASGLLELHGIHDLFTRMQRMDKVFIAAINGPAMGGGCELALACDLRYAADDGGPIGLPEMTLGFCPGAGGTQRLSRAVGPSRALEMILEAEPLAPQEALEAGLVHRVLPAADLLAEATKTARRLGRRSPISVAAAKNAVLGASGKALAAGLAEERRWFLAACSRPEAQQAMRAYVARVSPEGPPPWADPDALADFREGTAVDLVGGR